MAKHALLDHVIPPERELKAAKEALIESMRGVRGCKRSGEQYIASCICGSLIITSDVSEVTDFEVRHGRCPWPGAG